MAAMPATGSREIVNKYAKNEPQASTSSKPDQSFLHEDKIFESHEFHDDISNFKNLMQDDNAKSDHSSSNDDYEIEILGAEADATWVPPKKAFSWYEKVADIDLKDDEILNLSLK